MNCLWILELSPFDFRPAHQDAEALGAWCLRSFHLDLALAQSRQLRLLQLIGAGDSGGELDKVGGE